LRFDFTYPENLTTEQIKKVEDLVNEKIRENIPVTIEYTSLKNATDRGVLAFFGEKYNPEQVRIVEIPGFSAELCGGTHVRATGDIGAFKITDITALSAGHRRIFAVTGPKAIELFQDTFNTIKTLSQEFKVKREEVLEQVLKQKEQIKELQSHIKQIKSQLWHAQIPVWEKQVSSINSIPFLFISFTNTGADELRDIAATLAQKKPGFYFLLNSTENKSLFLVMVAPEFTKKINLKELSTWLAENYGLRGGGAKNMLQGGGDAVDASKLEEELKKWLRILG
jgi:alanyl-tRNA synthetase